MLSSVAALAIFSLSPCQALKGQAFLDDLSHRAVNFFWEQSNPESGLTRDRGPNTRGGKENNGNIASIASTGYALSAYAIGVKRGWLQREDVLKRARLTLETVLTKLEGRNGWYFHFVDWRTGKREWNCELSSIDSGLLFAGMVVAERGLNDPEYSRLCQKVLERIDWKFMLTDDGKKASSLTFSMGWRPEQGFLDSRWESYNELMFLYVLGFTFWTEMPAGSWAAWRRPEIEYQGYTMLNCGPLFTHQMSQGFFDFRDRRDALGYDYFVEGRNATLIHRLYCTANPKGFKGYGPDIWGLSACDIPTGYGAQGAPNPEEDNGTLAPAAAVASLIYTPDLSQKAAEAFIQKYPKSYGQYGFASGFDPTKDWYGPDVIGIDLGQMMLNIENARDGLIWKWTASNPKVQAAFDRMGLKKTSEGPLEKRPLRIVR